MIAKGTTHNNGSKLAAYMTTGKDGERAELWELRGFGATNIKDAFRDVHIMAGATKCEQPFFHVQLRNREGETLTREQWVQAADRIEAMLGLKGQARAIAFHTYERNGEEHMHVAWSRIDENTLTAKPLPFFKERLKKISRELELHFALEPVTNQREGKIKYAPTRAEDEQARRLGLDIHQIRNTIRACYERSDCGSSFQAALEHEGLTLAQGERRDFVVIDQAGGLHALGKRILDVTAAKIRDRLSDLPREQLPTIEMARAVLPEAAQEKQRQQEKTEPVWDRDRADRAWQDAVIHTAIEKEKAERQFVEPGKQKGREDSREKEQSERPDRPLGVAAADIRLAYSLSQSPDEFAKNLDQCGFRLACVTRDEAERSHRNAVFAKETGRFASEFREGEYVAINQRGHVYSLNQRTTGEARADIDAFMRTLDGREVRGIEGTLLHIAAYKRPAAARELWQNDTLTPWQNFGYAAREVSQRENAPEDLRGPSADIWTAYKRSPNARSFVRALQDRDITLAVATREDVTNSAIDRFYATSLTPVTPPQLREGDYVAVAENGRVYNLNWRTTGESADRVQKFMATLDRNEFQSVYAVLKTIEERAAIRDIERQAFRDLSVGKLKGEKDTRPAQRRVRPLRPDIVNGIESAAAVTKPATRSVGDALDVVGNALESLFAPKLTPGQIREGENATRRRVAEAENTIDFSRYTAELARQRQQQEQDREAARQRERDGRER